MASKHKVWRFQRSTSKGDVVSAMTHNRHFVMHFPMDALWELNFNGRFTFYATAIVIGTMQKPRLRVLREVTEGDWK